MRDSNKYDVAYVRNSFVDVAVLFLQLVAKGSSTTLERVQSEKFENDVTVQCMAWVKRIYRRVPVQLALASKEAFCGKVVANHGKSFKNKH